MKIVLKCFLHIAGAAALFVYAMLLYCNLSLYYPNDTSIFLTILLLTFSDLFLFIITAFIHSRSGGSAGETPKTDLVEEEADVKGCCAFDSSAEVDVITCRSCNDYHSCNSTPY